MDTRPQRQKGRDTTLSSLNAAIDAMNIAKDVMSMTPAKAAFGSVSIILTMIRVGSLPPVLVDCWLMYAGLHNQRRGLCRSWASLC